MPLRNLNRHLGRGSLRHSTRMLGGIHRPPPPNYLARACRALEQVLQLDKRLRPHLQEQIQLQKDRERQEEIHAALDRVYGPTNENAKAGLR